MKWRKWHAFFGLLAALPLIVTATTGLLLQLRSKVEWIQPSLVAVTLLEGKPHLSVEEVLAKYPGEVEGLSLRLGKGGFQLRLKNGNEVQLHPQTGEVLKDSPRRSTLLIKIHEGSWMGPFGSLGIHFISGLILVFLIISGIFIFPWRKRKRA